MRDGADFPDRAWERCVCTSCGPVGEDGSRRCATRVLFLARFFEGGAVVCEDCRGHWQQISAAQKKNIDDEDEQSDEKRKITFQDNGNKSAEQHGKKSGEQNGNKSSPEA